MTSSGRAAERREGGARDAGAQLARQLRAAGAGERDDDVAVRGAADEVVEALAVGRVQLQQPAEAGIGGLGHELPELALEAGRDEDGAAAGEGPQRCCGDHSGGGAGVHEREGHVTSRRRGVLPYGAGEPEVAGLAAGLGEAVRLAGLKPAA